MYNAIYYRINYIVSGKSDARYIINHTFARIRIDSYYSLCIEKALTFDNVIIFIKLVVNKNKNNYYYNIFLEKGPYKDKCNTYFFKSMFVYYKCYTSVELRFLKELMITKEANQKSAIFVTIAIF